MKRFVNSEQNLMIENLTMFWFKKRDGFKWALLLPGAVFILLASSCDSIKFADPFERPRPGSWVSSPANLSAEPQAKKGTILFLRIKDSSSHGRPVSLTFEALSPGAKSQNTVKFEIPNTRFESSDTTCLDGSEKIEEFAQSNAHLLRVCDTAIIGSLSNAGPISINYYGGTTRVLTGASSVRAIVDDYEVVVVYLD
jgi:hypothetical protein